LEDFMSLRKYCIAEKNDLVLGTKLMRAYFNLIYNPVYDFTTGRLNLYRQLQERCVGKLQFKDNDRVLCVGLGTGNEILHVLRMNRNVSIVGVDYSSTALRKAYQKASASGKEIEVLAMDARCLEFTSESFDTVLCIHVMDFIPENERVTDEILRVLKAGGQFVITYPSDKEGADLGLNILKDIIRHNPDTGKYRALDLAKSLGQMLAGIVYLPLFLRTKKRSYSHSELQAMISQLTIAEFQIDENPVYQDFIVCGRK